MRLSSKILILSACRLLAYGQQLVDPTSKDNSEECDCYLVDGPDPGFFQYHRFWDFRNISTDDGTLYTTDPDLVTAGQDQGNEAITSSYFNSSAWIADWSLASGPANTNGPVSMVDSFQNIFITQNSSAGSTYLTLRVSRNEEFSSASELDSNQRNLLHASIRARFRVVPDDLTNTSALTTSTGGTASSGSNVSHPVATGAVVGLFTYHSDTQESDNEILTRDDTSQIHFSNQPDYDAKTDSSVPGASTQVSLPGTETWTDWVDHRLDWFDGISSWYADGQFLLNKTINVPTAASGLSLNLWSDGGNWSGNMTVGSQVRVGIEWIDMVFNVSGKLDGSGSKKREVGLNKRESQCNVACNVDSIARVGYPEVAYNSTTSSASHINRPGALVNAFASVLVLGAAMELFR